MLPHDTQIFTAFKAENSNLRFSSFPPIKARPQQDSKVSNLVRNFMQ